jgi:hypothetical protein
MTLSAPMTEPARDVRQLTVDLHLRDPHELFVVSDFDPFVPDTATRSGVDQIKAAALSMKRPERISVTLFLPAETLTAETSRSLRAALTRYCTYRDEEIQAEIAAHKREAVSELKVGVVVFAACLILALLLLPLTTSSRPAVATIGALLSGALVIALWVVTWAPIESLFVEPIPLVWERRFLQRLQDMDLVIRADPA